MADTGKANEVMVGVIRNASEALVRTRYPGLDRQNPWGKDQEAPTVPVVQAAVVKKDFTC